MAYCNDDKMYHGYIYKITNNINRKIYIGQTKRTIEIRWNQHLNSFKENRDNMLLYKAMKKYGVEQFMVSVIAEYCEESESLLLQKLNDAEINYISLLTQWRLMDTI